jgi:C_GCAxxG_C_C family probable redox protein
MPSELSKKAIAIMEERRGSCSQAIFSTYGEYLSSGKVDYNTCMNIASAFSGGIAGTGYICGALSGALMALGLKYNNSEKPLEINIIAKKVLSEFESLHGTTICRELINHDLLTDADMKHAFETGAFDNCGKYVEDVASILDKLLDL